MQAMEHTEFVPPAYPWDGVVLNISPEVRREMEDQLISDEDVKECIFTAQESGGGFVQEDGTRLGMLVREVLTYWVEYRPADGENTFDVHTAYVHRMRLGEEEENHG